MVTEDINPRDEVERLTRVSSNFADTLRKLGNCDWVISLPDRMVAVRKIARDALIKEGYDT